MNYMLKKLNNLEEMENLNRSTTSKTESVITKTFHQRKTQDQMASLVNFTKHLRKK